MHILQQDEIGGAIFDLNIVTYMDPLNVNISVLRDRAEELAQKWVEEHGTGFYVGFDEDYLRLVREDIKSIVQTAKVTTDIEGNVYIKTHDESGEYLYGFNLRPTWFI